MLPIIYGLQTHEFGITTSPSSKCCDNCVTFVDSDVDVLISMIKDNSIDLSDSDNVLYDFVEDEDWNDDDDDE